MCPALSAADLSLAIGEGGAEVIVESADIVLQCGGLDYAAEARYFSLCRSPAVHHPNHPIPSGRRAVEENPCIMVMVCT